MKLNKRTNLLYLTLLVALSSCFTYSNIQVQELRKDDNSENLIFENNDLKISYFVWGQYGQLKTFIYNKSDSIIKIDLELSHFVENGFAYPFMNNAITSYTSSVDNKYVENSLVGNTLLTNTYSNGIKITNQTIPTNSIYIPPKSTKVFNLFTFGSIYSNCNLKKATDSSSLTFNQSNSPFNYRTLFYYSFNKSESNIQKFENNFWTSKISNLSEYIYIKKEDYYLNECKKGIKYSKSVNGYLSGNRFYINYSTN
jgi:hypothetical protein